MTNKINTNFSSRIAVVKKNKDFSFLLLSGVQMMARELCALVLFCLGLLYVDSKLAERATVNVTHPLSVSCTGVMLLRGITNMTEECYGIRIVKHSSVGFNKQNDLTMVDRTVLLSVTLSEGLIKQNHDVELRYNIANETGQLKFLYSPDSKDLPGYYTFLHLCIGAERLEYETDSKTVTIGWSDSGVLSSVRDSNEFKCKLIQRIDLLCNTGCGCNTSMEVSPQVGQGDGGHEKQSQPSWHCEGDRPRSAAQPPSTCYLKFWCSRLDCPVKYKCTRRRNTANIFDCSWDQDNSIHVSCTVTDNTDNITDDVKNEEQGSGAIQTVIPVLLGIFVLVLLPVNVMKVYKYSMGRFVNCPQSAPAAKSCPDQADVQPDAKDDGSNAGQSISNEGGADERLLSAEHAASTVGSIKSRPGQGRSAGVKPAERSSSVQIEMEDNESISELEDGASAAAESVSKRSRAGRIKNQPADVQHYDRGRYYDPNSL